MGTIEHIEGVANEVADMFSRVKAPVKLEDIQLCQSSENESPLTSSQTTNSTRSRKGTKLVSSFGSNQPPFKFSSGYDTWLYSTRACLFKNY